VVDKATRKDPNFFYFNFFPNPKRRKINLRDPISCDKECSIWHEPHLS